MVGSGCLEGEAFAGGVLEVEDEGGAALSRARVGGLAFWRTRLRPRPPSSQTRVDIPANPSTRLIHAPFPAKNLDPPTISPFSPVRLPCRISPGRGIRIDLVRRKKIVKTCSKCGSHDFGIWTSASTGRVNQYCRACRRVRAAQYTARKKLSSGSHTRREWLQKLQAFDKCPGCGLRWSDIPKRPDRRYRFVWTKDHIIPLTRGGGDDISNIQPLCYRCNSSKCNGRQIREAEEGVHGNTR